MASLENKKIKDTYVGLLKTNDNNEITGPVLVTDGAGNSTGVTLSNDGRVTATGTVSFASLKDTAEDITITKFVDEADGIANNDNDTTIPTSAAIKNYVDTNVTAQDLDFSGNTGTGDVDLDSETFEVTGSNGITTTALNNTLEIDGSTLQTNIATNAADISNEESARIDADTTLQTNIDAEASTRATADTTLQSNIDTEAATRLANDNTLQGNIDTNTASISTNTSNIATNTSNISETQGDIETNSTNITNLTSSVSTNTGNISTNTGSIGTNATNISNNASAISTNSTDISTNASGISTNATNITTNTSSISTNTTNISTNTTNISTNASDISTNEDNINANTIAITGKVSQQGDTMTGDLTVNANLNVGGISQTRLIKATDASGNDVLKIEKNDDDVNLYLNDNNSSNNDSKIVFQSTRADNNTYIGNFNNYDDGDESHNLSLVVDGSTYLALGYNDIVGTPPLVTSYKPIFAQDGIYFGTTSVSKKLDDYEEGTYTPSVTASGTDTTGFTTNGYYTKIGDIVHVEIRLYKFVDENETCLLTNVTLPFAANNTSTIYYKGGMWHSDTFDRSNLFSLLRESTTNLTPYNGTANYLTLAADEGNQIGINITYKAQ